jgi:glycosyltransferase involved in cell wall biosynthesis
MRNLILITNHYPHGRAESFVDYEIPFLQQRFDKVIILSKNKDEQTFRGFTFINYRIDSVSTVVEKIKIVAQSFLYSALIIRHASNEYKSLRRNKKTVSFQMFKIAVHDVFKALATAGQIKSIIRKENLNGTLLLYSYWLTNSALATTFIDSTGDLKVSRIARAHGGDVYEERHASNYLSFREALVSSLDFVFPISDHGTNHLRKLVPESIHHKLMTKRLGTNASASVSAKKDNGVFTLVSCSFMVPVKRIELIIESLALIKNLPIQIQWIHIGGGPLFKEMKEKAHVVTLHNASLMIDFMGTLSSAEIVKFYTSHYVDLFINTSAYEGIPVSMMEAQSFGIPILGINTGGVSEIVNDSVGILVEQNEATPLILAQHILKCISMESDEAKTKRTAARKSWEAQYQASENFSTFAHLLSTL